jgi:hypothetical protein
VRNGLVGPAAGYGGQIDRASRSEHDEIVVEYASITAALAILASSLGGALGSAGALPSTNVKAAALVSTAAAKQKVQGADARAAYARAPFRRPALRYLYVVGWVTAARDRTACQAALLLGPDPRAVATHAIRRSLKMLARLRSAHVTVGQSGVGVAVQGEDTVRL